MDYKHHSSHHWHHTHANPHGGHGHHHHHHHHHHSPALHPKIQAHRASIICVAGAILAFAILVVRHITVLAQKAPPNGYFIGAATVFALLSFGFGFYAAIIQIRYRSPSVQKRLVFGLTVTALVLIDVGAEIFKRYSLLDLETGHPQGETLHGESTPPAGQSTEDNVLFKPGWYGEARREGLQAVIVSFPENAAESRQFNRRVSHAVSYAALAIMNLGNSPIEMKDWEPPVLVLKSGEERKSLPALDYLREQRDRNKDLLTALSVGGTLPPGRMCVSLPVCMPSAFDWGEVAFVLVKIGGKELKIEGRMMTAEERRLQMETDEGTEQTDHATNSVTDYYDNL